VSYTLAEHGDFIEKQGWQAFLNDEFPTYGAVWADYIVSLTQRPEGIHFKSDAGLAEIGRDAADICHAQVHYTTLTHLPLVAGALETSHEVIVQIYECSAGAKPETAGS
jgi:hypothetical protein